MDKKLLPQKSDKGSCFIFDQNDLRKTIKVWLRAKAKKSFNRGKIASGNGCISHKIVNEWLETNCLGIRDSFLIQSTTSLAGFHLIGQYEGNKMEMRYLSIESLVQISLCRSSFSLLQMYLKYKF